MAGDLQRRARRVLVVKIGSSTLAGPDDGIDRRFLDALADQVARLRDSGWATVVVSSGAIACGLVRLGMAERPADLPSLQAAASVGQPAFAAAYGEAFAARGLTTSLVLLTRHDTAERSTYLHARDALMRLLDLGVVPIVNGNDTVSVEQIRFGDNDTLGALVACLTQASLCVILSDINGFYDANPRECSDARLMRRVERIDQQVIDAAGAAGTGLGTGGMVTKVRAARALGLAGIPLVVCQGREPDALARAVRGDHAGTLFASPRRPGEVSPRKLWIALGDSARGAVTVDEGARRAIQAQGGSLLCVGVTQVEGGFERGDVIDVRDPSGFLFARGLAGFNADEVALACGRTRDELAANRLLRELAERALIHRDNLVVFA
ncbi:glutamate 5-kinase [Berryella wangjianweii]|uniref:glutamate 5-kinase n=1 Tax=Berryella wangjianweii TaxID=2734634 RepID=UPI0021BDC8FD|nr:glutamate 5-kinase [Berryella wangjianweii]